MSSPVEARFEAAIRSYWQVRDAQAAKQSASGKVDAGTRGSVTGGGHLNAVASLLEELFIENGFAPRTIKRTSSIELPGFYRPSKKWDLVVIDDGKLVAAIELKSQVGPSFGNNFNNRTEEAIGNAVDVWRAYEEGTFGGVRPWLGYVFLLEEDLRSTTPVRLAKTVFPVERVFDDTPTRIATVSFASDLYVNGSMMSRAFQRHPECPALLSISRTRSYLSTPYEQRSQDALHTSKPYSEGRKSIEANFVSRHSGAGFEQL